MAKKVKIVLIILIAISFLAFYTLGYDVPSLRNPSLIEPVMTPFIIGLMIGILLIAIVLTVVSIICGIRKGNGRKVVNNIPLTKIGWGVMALLLISLILTFLLGSSDSILVNGKVYDDTLWLRVSSMFVITSGVMIVVAIAIAAASMIKKMKD